MTDTHTATCRCGKLRITVSGPPAMTAACHCAGCQAMTASAFSVTAMYHEDQLTIAGDTVQGGLKGAAHHHCCPDCLSWMFTRAEMMGPMVNVHSAMLGALRDAPPFIETFTSEKLDWAQTGAVHSFREFPAASDYDHLMAEFRAARGTA